MAAAYGVSLGGALFALEVMRGMLALRYVLPALLASVVATALAWIVHDRVTEELRCRVNDMGRTLGPPWRQDEKSAALVGWLALLSTQLPA